MKFSLAFFASACLIFQVTSSEYPDNVNPRIHNGDEAPQGKYPYQAAIMVNSWLICSGSILNEYWILTAAHCLTHDYDLSVWVGSNNIGSKFNGQIYKVENVTTHENFNKNGQVKNDIGLIRLSSKIIFNNLVKKIELTEKNVYLNGTKAVFSGWGYTVHYLPEDLHEIKLEIQDHENCKSFWGIVTDKQICTIHKEEGGICSGDSGGPLVLDGNQIGIASYGKRECGSGTPQVFTRVYYYLDWIDKQMEHYTIE